MRSSRTVGWSSLRGELQFIADDPGPLLMVTPALLEQAILQRDDSWLLRGYTQPDYSEWCEFTVRTPTMQLARSLVPQQTATTATGQDASSSLPTAPVGRLEWQPAPPRPASGVEPPVSFYSPRNDPVERTEVVDFNPEPTVPLTPELYDIPEVITTAEGYTGDTTWIVRYVLNDPNKPDETQRSMEVQADSDAHALRAMHAEMKKTAEEPSYRVLSVVQASHAGIAA